MEHKGNFYKRLWLALCPLLSITVVIMFADTLKLMLSPFSGISFTMIVTILFLALGVVWSFFYNIIIDLIFLVKWITTGSKRDEFIKQEIEVALEKVRLQLNDLNKVAPEELKHYAKKDFVNDEINRANDSLENKLNDLTLGFNKGKITSLPTPKQESSTENPFK